MEIGGGNRKLTRAVVGTVELWNPHTPSTMLCLMEPAGRSASGSRCRRWSATASSAGSRTHTRRRAKGASIANQVLVAQMFFSGYGTPKNEYKV